MTLQQAVEFFAQHGNVWPDPLRLKAEKPTLSQLETAARNAIAQGQSEQLANEAKEVIIRCMRISTYAPKQSH
jgi:hypothetical protein